LPNVYFGDPQARLITLVRRTKKQSAARVRRRIGLGTTADNGAYGTCRAGIIESIWTWRCGGFSGAVKREKLEFLLENALHTERFARTDAVCRPKTPTAALRRQRRLG